jgi:hypothetical protein
MMDSSISLWTTWKSHYLQLLLIVPERELELLITMMVWRKSRIALLPPGRTVRIAAKL